MKSNFLLLLLLKLCINVSAQSIPAYSIVINEIFPDPSPALGLPPFEFVEIYNASQLPFSLKGCKLSDGSSTATISVAFILQPDSFLILCPSSATATYQVFGSTVGLSNFPSLNNDKDRLVFLSPEGKTIHALEYELSWYQNKLKEEGGWSLEMQDPQNPCGGAKNWSASQHYSGGTPGKKNSVYKINPDQSPPMLLRSYSKDAQTLMLVFDESLDSQSVWKINNFQLQPTGPQPLSMKAQAPLFKELEVALNSKMDSQQVYRIAVANMRDCSGNYIGAYNQCFAGISKEANKDDLVLNELMFNPPPDGGDYVEVYNSSKKIIDLSHYLLCNRKTTGELYNFYPICSNPWYLFPNSHAVITTHPEWLQKNRLVKYPQQIISIDNLPSLPDDEGILVLANLNLQVLDELHYQHLWHHPLLVNEEGVALERVNYKLSTQNRLNWSSATANAGYGTPGYQNSVFILGDSLKGEMSLQPSLITPDNDGIDDRLTITVESTDISTILSISIFDLGGHLIRQLIPSQSISGKGIFFWDGLNDQFRMVARGHYWVVAELTTMGGKVKKKRGLVAVMR